MIGFFDTQETASTTAMRKITGCGACKLHRSCQSPRVEVFGEGKKRILIIGEAPSAEEDRHGGLKLGGIYTMYLQRELRRYGIDLEEDCWKLNAIACHPPNGREPSSFEIECCRPKVVEFIETHQPHLILTFGSAALKSVLEHRWKKGFGAINKWRGWRIPDRDFKSFLCPTFHPSYVAQFEDKDPVLLKVWQRDIKQAIRLLDHKFPLIDDEAMLVKILDGEGGELKTILRNIIEWRLPFAFDYETTGLKPHANGHQIVSCAMALSNIECYSFDMPVGENLELLKEVFKSPLVPKIGQNIKYEDNWTNVILGIQIQNWVWDTMLASHVLDNRESITGLKFQSYVNFGLLPYDEHIEPYLKSDSSNGLNRIHEAPRKDRLIYNGIDAIMTWKLALKQMKILDYPVETILH